MGTLPDHQAYSKAMYTVNDEIHLFFQKKIEQCFLLVLPGRDSELGFNIQLINMTFPVLKDKSYGYVNRKQDDNEYMYICI